MVQLNLLPEVKLEYIAIKKQKRFVTLLATFVIIGSIGVTLLLALVVYGAQAARISSVQNSIKSNTSKLQNTEGLNEILTVQNQLSALDALHEDKPVVSKLFAYLSQVIPVNSTITTLTLDTTTSTITITGESDSLQDVNKLVDTLKFVEISRGEEGEESRPKAFSQVVLSGFDRTLEGATFTLNLTYDPLIFSNAEDKIVLIVPETVSTRSTTEQPKALFDKSEQPTGEQ
jgi:Tfp pilus assembly protein PilN